MKINSMYQDTKGTIEEIIRHITGVQNIDNAILDSSNHNLELTIDGKEYNFTVIPSHLFAFLVEQIRCPECGHNMEHWKQKGEYYAFSCSNEDCEYSTEGDLCDVNLDDGDLTINEHLMSYAEYSKAINKTLKTE